jgi:hypothetical protein
MNGSPSQTRFQDIPRFSCERISARNSSYLLENRCRENAMDDAAKHQQRRLPFPF